MRGINANLGTYTKALWNAQSLARQFLFAGGLVSIVAMVVVGVFVTTLIKTSVTRNAAATTALYVDSIIAPLLPDIQRSTELDVSVQQALDETLNMGALGRRLVEFKIWRADGTILYSKDKSLVGKRFGPSKDLRNAWQGRVIAQLDEFDAIEAKTEGARGVSLLEIYNPILQPWSGEVVAVSEFYEVADDLRADLRHALWRAWAVVAAVTGAIFGTLATIVLRGSRTIDQQRVALAERVKELSDLLAANDALRTRVQQAAERATASNEQYLRRIGADLHDGPAQLVALASLTMDSAALDADAPTHKRETAVNAIRRSLDDAMMEIRSICNGLMLPSIETAELRDIVALAVASHEQRTLTKVQVSQRGNFHGLFLFMPPQKICVYRFLQEGLNNAYRHTGGAGQRVDVNCGKGLLTLAVTDSGQGFDVERAGGEGLGLAGLRDRIESLGGTFSIETSTSGTRLSMTLKVKEPPHDSNPAGHR
ncbi:sensor histidine kinase [Oryzicola mucosus]|uniref:Oxygen sensor histidine kinase NreB n=1 Tax=Oryzicola mucosus TaxID=2767425 RepID=A0A8J6TY22_9HYPH|nr:ATP-binding protein [Oryzicola mucosus]MBD0413904.1 sensor histidine kinase [Oryzicola mucosus]